MPRRQIKKPKQSVKGRKYEYPVPDSSPSIKDNPIFSFHYLQDSHCISQCNIEQKVSFVDKMRALSKLSWNQIVSTHHHGLGLEKIPRDRFFVSIPDYITSDETLIALRFWKLAPMVGVRRRQVFHIIWFDKDFNVYDHGA
jgi:hypothetical protein